MHRPVVSCTMIVLASLALAGCQPAVWDPQGPVGAAQLTILINSLAIMLAIVLPTIVATLGFRLVVPRLQHQGALAAGLGRISGQLELIVWAIPLLTIMLLGGVAWIGSHELDPARPLASKDRPLDVQVVSLDWKWLFIYPGQQVASVNHLVIPAGTPIHFTLTSASVMNAFFIPQLGSMIYTMNRMATAAQPVAPTARAPSPACRATTAATALPTCISMSMLCRAIASAPGSTPRAAPARH